MQDMSGRIDRLIARHNRRVERALYSGELLCGETVAQTVRTMRRLRRLRQRVELANLRRSWIIHIPAGE